jgi:hypothetical protein
MANENVILKVGVEGTGEGETKIKSLKAQLKEMKNELLGLDEGSERFKKLSKDAGELTDRIGDINQKVNALSSDTKKLDALVGAGSAIAGGFQAASGAMALFGSDSKKVEESIKNIIAIQGVLNGVQQVSQFLTAKGIIQDKLAMIAMGAKAALLKVVTAAQWLWNAAVTANPIGLIIVGVAALGTGIYLLVKNIKSVIAVFSDWKNVALALLGPIGWILIYMNEMDKAEKALGSTREKQSKANTEQYNKRMAEIKAERAEQEKAHTDRQEQFDRQIARYEAEGKSSYALRLQKLEDIKAEKEAILQSNKDIIAATVDRYTVEAQLRGKSLEEFLASIGIQYDDTKKILEDSLKDQEEAIYDADTNIIALKKQHNDALKSEADKLAEEEEAARLKAEADEEARQRKQIEDQMELAANKKKLLEDQRAADKAEADKLREEESKQRIADAEAEIALEKEKQAAKQKLVEDYSKAVIGLTQNIFTITNNLGKQDEESRKKRAQRQFQIKKALDMAEAAIDGTKAVLSTFANTPGGLVIKGLAATAAGVFAAAKIAAIGSAKFDGGGATASVGSVSNAGDSVENVGNTTPNNPIQSGSTFLNSEKTQQVLVVEDVNSMQKKVKAIEALASFG